MVSGRPLRSRDPCFFHPHGGPHYGRRGKRHTMVMRMLRILGGIHPNPGPSREREDDATPSPLSAYAHLHRVRAQHIEYVPGGAPQPVRETKPRVHAPLTLRTVTDEQISTALLDRVGGLAQLGVGLLHELGHFIGCVSY